MNQEFDLDALRDEIVDALAGELEQMMEDKLEDKLEEAVENAVNRALPEALCEALASFDAVLPSGAVLRPRPLTRVLSPDRSKQLVCRGGLRADGNTLMVQTRISCWEALAVYPSHEEAVRALLKVKAAMDAGAEALEL